jgi:hypothetical protein
VNFLGLARMGGSPPKARVALSQFVTLKNCRIAIQIVTDKDELAQVRDEELTVARKVAGRLLAQGNAFGIFLRRFYFDRAT